MKSQGSVCCRPTAGRACPSCLLTSTVRLRAETALRTSAAINNGGAVHRQSVAVAGSQQASDDQAFVDAISLLNDGSGDVVPGARGTVGTTFGPRQFTVSWEVRGNAVWRCGRVFLRCPRCAGRCTRLYVPTPETWLACRTCWGLTYASRTLRNYKDSLWGRGKFARMIGTSQREWAFELTNEDRDRRLDCSRQRWEDRRATLILKLRRGPLQDRDRGKLKRCFHPSFPRFHSDIYDSADRRVDLSRSKTHD